jgi:DNA ligase (NAD+)
MSFKHDGIALSIEYENGILKKAGLRSKSGKDGIDVTDKTFYIQGIPQQLTLPLTCTIRGEIETPILEFNRISAELGEDAKANPRAHAAGSMNQKKAENIKNRGLRFTAYNILSLKDPPYTTEIERAEWATKVLKLNYIKLIPFKITMLKMFEEQHRRLDFMVDGVVISVNNLDYQYDLGNTGDKDTGNPKGKLAWKFKDEVQTTIVKDIIWQTGRTGNVTPVLIINPVQLEGTTVSRCTAHNIGIIKSNNIGIGSKVEIIKSGKIIPKLHKVIDARGQINSPKNCPSCNKNLIITSGTDGALALVCDNIDCPARGIKNLNHYLKALGVKGIAESTINKLADAGILQQRSDFYKLTLSTLLNNGITERTAILILARIWMIPSPEQEKDNNILENKLKNISTITVPLDKLIASFGIEGAGKEIGRLLSKKYRDLGTIRNLTIDELETVGGIGSITAKSVHSFFSKNKNEIDCLLQFIKLEVPVGKSGKFDGKQFVLSGSFEMGKEYWKAEIEKNGGEVRSSVSKKVHYVVAGPGSGLKSEKATELGIPIIEEEELETMLKG